MRLGRKATLDALIAKEDNAPKNKVKRQQA